MGYETSLRINGKTLLEWRKYAGEEPRMLFRHSEVSVRWGAPATTAYDDERETGIVVELKSTAGEVLETLADSGIGWAASIAAYSEIRQDVVSTSLLHVDHMLRDGRMRSPAEVDTEYRESLAAFERVPPVSDLDRLGEVLAHQFESTKSDLLIFDDISLGGTIESATDIPFRLQRYAREAGIDPYPAIRAAESWMVLNRDAPLLAWPLLVCVLLHKLPADYEVVFDLTDDARENDVDSLADGYDFANAYWTRTSAGISSVAKTMGRLFSVLASFDSKLGHEYWFARAAALRDRLHELNHHRGETSTKVRGDALESLVEAIMKTDPGFDIVERNVRSADEEIDILASNRISDPFWQAMTSPLVLIECKNTASRVGVPALRVFESKMRDRSGICRIGIFVAMSGFTKTFTARLREFTSDSGIIFAVSGEELTQIIDGKVKLSDWLRGPGIRRSVGGSY